MPQFNLIEGSPQFIAMNSTAPVQILAGGYGWGKTSLLCLKALQLCQDYPGCHGGIFRNTKPNLETTIKKEFFKWCPESWIKKMPNDRDRTLVLENGSEIIFNYIKLSTRGDSETMNMLSATFDWIIIDQLEDPEFSYKLFQDLQGRLRGTAVYVGNEDKPKYANYFMATTNPTKNWINSKLVRPLHVFQTSGTVLPELLKDEKLFRETGQVKPIIDLIEGTTYDNAENLPDGFIERLENVYTGSMRDKFMLGKWDVADNMVYPMFNYAIHVIPEAEMRERYFELKRKYDVPWRESLDFGIASQSCYLASFIDTDGNFNLMDGWYEKELHVREQATRIMKKRMKWGISNSNLVISDPALFRRTAVDTTVADQFSRNGIMLTKGMNNILGGIAKVGDILNIDPLRINPYTKSYGSPSLFVSDELQFWIDEIVDYRYKAGRDGTMQDMPVDKNDHAMDSTKYLLTYNDDKATLLKAQVNFDMEIRKWREC